MDLESTRILCESLGSRMVVKRELIVFSMLNTTGYIRTLWNRDAYTVPPGTNLYGDHPVYFDHRGNNGTHAVFLLNSNGGSSPHLSFIHTDVDVHRHGHQD